MLGPYLKGGVGSFSHQGITMFQDLIGTHQSTSSAVLVSVFTRFMQARMLPSESIIQYCSRVRGFATELGRLVQPISEPLIRLLVIHGITPQFVDYFGQVATDVINVINGFDNWDAFIRRIRDYATHANICPSPASATSMLDPADLVWIGQPNPNRSQASRLMSAFTCPIHRHNDHPLHQFGMLKSKVAVTSKAEAHSDGGYGRGGAGRGSDDRGHGGRGRGGRGCRNQESSEPADAPPSTKTTPTGAPGVSTIGSAAHADTAAPPLAPGLPPDPTQVPASPRPSGTIAGDAGFATHLSNNPFAALSPPPPVSDPNTTSTSIPASTLDMDFTYAFAASQGIVTRTIGNHSKPTVSRYIDSACQVMFTPPTLSAIQETCLSVAKSTPPNSQHPILALRTLEPRIISSRKLVTSSPTPKSLASIS
jgi:hypothetical protein